MTDPGISRRAAIIAAAAAAATVVVGGQVMAAAPPTLSSPSDIEKLYKAAMAAGDATLVAPAYAEDAKLMRPDGALLDGRVAIQAELQHGYDTSKRRLQDSKITVKGDDTNAVLLWEWTLAVTPNGGSLALTTGRSLQYWTKGADGWQIVYDFYQTY